MTVWHIAFAYGVGFFSGLSVILVWLFAAAVPEDQAANTPRINDLMLKGVPTYHWGNRKPGSQAA